GLGVLLFVVVQSRPGTPPLAAAARVGPAAKTDRDPGPAADTKPPPAPTAQPAVPAANEGPVPDVSVPPAPRPAPPAVNNPPEPPASLPKVPPPATDFPGLIAYWPFEDDNPAERVADRSSNGNDGKAVGARRVEGVRGTALAFADQGYFD